MNFSPTLSVKKTGRKRETEDRCKMKERESIRTGEAGSDP